MSFPALRALYRTYLDLQNFAPEIQIKLFVRNDLNRRITVDGFVNLTHVQAKSTSIVWRDEDLYALLCRRIRQSDGLMRALGLDQRAGNEAVFARIFPPQVDAGDRKPTTWKWILSRIQDGNGVKSPRNLIDLVNEARKAQIQTEERGDRKKRRTGALIEAESLKIALGSLSELRVNDTLFAENKKLAGNIRAFKGEKAEQTRETIALILRKKGTAVDEVIGALMEVGFVQEVGSSFRISMLYRAGLQIKQGKAFTDDED